MMSADRNALIAPFESDDPVLGQVVSVTVSDQYSILKIGKRYYYFDRKTGILDGTGTDE